MTDLASLRAIAEAATPGPWGIWVETCSNVEAAIAELAEQCRYTEPFVGGIYLLDAGGKCPATTGCGPKSEANATFIATFNPATALALLDRVERAEAAPAETAPASEPNPIPDAGALEPVAKQWRKKPVVIEATQWFKIGDHPAVYLREPLGDLANHNGPVPWVQTLEGGHVVTPGDWIITGIKGEHYPCKPDIFALTYEPALVLQSDHIQALQAAEAERDDFKAAASALSADVTVFGQKLEAAEAEIERLKESRSRWHLNAIGVRAQRDAAEADRARLTALLARAGEVLKPFSEVAGELFATNKNNPDVVYELNGIGLVTREFFAARQLSNDIAEEIGR